jgi:hypothetical protein
MPDSSRYSLVNADHQLLLNINRRVKRLGRRLNKGISRVSTEVRAVGLNAYIASHPIPASSHSSSVRKVMIAAYSPPEHQPDPQGNQPALQGGGPQDKQSSYAGDQPQLQGEQRQGRAVGAAGSAQVLMLRCIISGLYFDALKIKAAHIYALCWPQGILVSLSFAQHLLQQCMVASNACFQKSMCKYLAC